MSAQQEIAAWLEGRSGLFALFHIDVRAMRRVNLAFGLDHGDALLAAVAARLEAWMQGEGYLGRPWGGEFSLIRAVDSPMDAIDQASRMLQCLQEAPELGALFPVDFGALNRYAVGVVVIRSEDSVDASLRAAMASCAEAKRRGSSEVVFHAPDQLRRGAMEEDLHNLRLLQRCLQEGQLEVHAQPIVRLQEQGFPIAKAEILVRLDPRDAYGKAPQYLLETARSMRVMPDVDAYIVRHAIDALREHPGIVAELENVSINLSAQTLMDGPTMHAIFDMVTGSGIAASKLAFEITETEAVEQMEETRQKIENLRRLGCRFVLDDFGVGYCSFGYLSRLPVDEVKIDGLFVREIDERVENELIIRAIHTVSAATGKKTTAEFIENEDVAHRLRDIGIDYGQGWAFHPAMTLPELEKLL